MTSNHPDSPGTTSPAWAGYAITVLLEAILTALLLMLRPVFPLGEFPITYVIIIMLVAYVFGEGPAIVAFVLGLLAFDYFFVPPYGTLLPHANTARGSSSLVAFLLGASIVGFSMIMIRRSQRRIMRLADELRESNRRMDYLIGNSPLGVIEWDADYRITRWAGEATRIFGWTGEETLGVRIDEIKWVYEEDWGSVRSVMADMLSGARPRNVNKNRNYRKDGSVIYCEWYNSALLDESGKLRSVLSLVLDVTERTLAEQVLGRYQLLSEHARDVVLFVKRDGRIIEANDAALRTYGYTHEELLSLSVYDLRAPETLGTIPEQLAQADEKGILFETIHRRKDGSSFPVEVSSQGTDIDGQRVLLSIIRDITDRVKLRKALEQQVSQLQRALLPESPSIGDGYMIATRYVAGQVGEEIGGDFYDVFETEDGKVGILIGDVTGKGIHAAALAAATRSTVRAFAYEMSDAGEALTHTNSVLIARQGDPDAFVTVFLAVLDLSSGEIRYANAGHPPAMIHRAGTGAVETLGLGHPPLTVMEQFKFDDYEGRLEPGDRIVFYTDGVSEARRNLELLGAEGVELTLKKYGDLPPDELAEKILEAAKDWALGPLADDVAIIVVERPQSP